MNQPKHYVDREVRKPESDELFFFHQWDKLLIHTKHKILDEIVNTNPEVGYKVFPLEGDE